MTVLTILCLLVLAALFVMRWRFSFAAQPIDAYDGIEPRMDITQHLAGPLESEGIIYGPTGRVESRFVARMQGTFGNRTGTLDENFTYGTGETQTRQWRLTLGENGRFTAEADDVIGVGEGVHSGNSVRMTYKLRLSEEAGGHVLDVVDWMYLMDNGTVMNKSEMRKYGIKVAELVANFRPIKEQA